MRRLILLLFMPIYSWGQPNERSAPLTYEECNPERFAYVPPNDTVRQRAIIDSTTKMLVGRWELAEEGAGACFVAAHAPAQATQIRINQQGQGLLLVAGSQVARFQLQLSFYWSNVHFVMNQDDNANYFEFFPQKNGPSDAEGNLTNHYPNILRVCEATLILYGPRTGLSYVFRRIAD
ncbi:hypothetical protein J2I47_07985 [Fibrella sp. HMF5335]|uniref:Uncharacterized protein n=1 Tax=Fibrella rubiginis TaxID=2817060 RepID=A0A939GFV3_9BACT|nr:hypothetical protein [Fibrella rubiginis]MBO0936479.1 hypothetical protein [Fibrella rubiginis]